MALKNCIKITAGLSNEDVTAILESFDSYKDSMSDKDAGRLAIEDAISSLETERKEVLGIYEAAYPGVPTGRIQININRPHQETEKAVDELKAKQSGWGVNDHYKVAHENQVQLNTIAGEISKKVGAEYHHSPEKFSESAAGEKSRESTERKVAGKYAGSANKLTDIVRGTFILSSPSDVEKVVDQLGAFLNGVDEGWAITDTGYFDRKILIQFDNGQIGELQLVTKNVRDAKEAASLHDIYQDWRAAVKVNPETGMEEIEAGKEFLSDLQKRSMMRGYAEAVGSETDSEWLAVYASIARERLSTQSSRELIEITLASSETSRTGAGAQAPSRKTAAEAAPSGVEKSTAGSLLKEKDLSGLPSGKSIVTSFIESAARRPSVVASAPSIAQTVIRDGKTVTIPETGVDREPGDFTQHGSAPKAPPKKGIAVDRLKKLVNILQREHHGTRKIGFHIFATQAEAFGKNSVSEHGIVKGGFYSGTNEIVLIAENIKDFDDAIAVVRHEVVGHYGIREALGTGYDKLLDRVYKARDSELKELYDWVASAYPELVDSNDVRKIADEMLARAAETKPKSNLLDWVYDQIVKLFQKAGLVWETISRAEVRSLIRLSEAKLRQKIRASREVEVPYPSEYERHIEDDGSYGVSEKAQLDLFSPTNVPKETAHTQAVDNFNVRYKQVEVGKIRTGITKVTSAEEAAHVLAPIRKHAQETMMAVVLDKNKEIIHIIRHSKGIKDSTTVSALEIVAAIGATEGAASFWMGHNHPSGGASPSTADKRMTTAVNDALDGSGLEMNGHIVIGGAGKAFLLNNKGDSVGEIDVKPFARRDAAPITERMIRKNKMNESTVTITSSEDAVIFVRNSKTKNGLLLINAKHQVIGVLTMSPKEMNKLRDGKQIPRILKTLDETNAAAVIIVAEVSADVVLGKDRVVKNIGNYLSIFRELRVLDAVVRYGTNIEAYGSSGKEVPSGGKFYSKQQDAFYSQLLRHVREKLPGSGTPSQIQDAINAYAKKGQIKKEELEWSGVMDWLDEQSGKVSKSDITDFLKANQVQVEEIEKGREKFEELKAVEKFRAEMEAKHGTTQSYEWPGADSERLAILQQKADHPQFVVKFADQQLPGGKNYRELLLTLPVEKETVTEEHEQILGPKKKIQVTRDMPSYKGGHYQEPNVIAHIRFNERTDADGKRVLFIEEVQSDWHQQGRKKGYRSGQEKLSAFQQDMKVKYSEDRVGHLYQKMDSPDKQKWDMLLDKVTRGEVPNAPFKTTWPLLAMKHMIRHASENGFDRVAWTTGEQQSDRYDLGKQIHGLMYTKTGDGTYSIKTIKKSGDRPILLQSGVPENKLSDYVGKGLAEKIANEEGSPVAHTPYKSFYGVDLKVGGKGMVSFYDKMLPSMVNKYVKKWGTKVGETKLSHELVDEFDMDQMEELQTAIKSGEIKLTAVHSIDVTDDMKKAAMAGQPMFRKEAPDLFSRAARQANDAPVDQNLGMPEEDLKDKFVRYAQDAFSRVKTLQRTIEERGGEITPESDVYKAEERSSGRIAYRLKRLDKDYMIPLMDMMKEKNISIDELDQFLVASHAKERNDYIASINDDMPDGGSGMTNREAAEILSSFANRAKDMNAVAAIVYAVNNRALDDMVAGGHLDAEVVDEWKTRWKYYIPLKGKEGEEQRPGTGSGFSIAGAGIKKAMGRGAGNLAESPTAHSFAQAESTIVRTEKTKVGQALVKLIRAHPDPAFWTISKQTYKKFEDLFGEPFEGYEEPPEGMIENLDYHRVTAITQEERAAAKAEGRKPVGKVVYMLDRNYKQRDDVFAVMVDGQELLIQVKDQVLMEQLKKMNTTQLNAVVAGFGTVNRYLAMINTALNPEFVITNFERDFQTAMINLGGEHSTEIAAKVMKSIPGAIRGIWQATFDTKGQSEWRDLFNEMEAEGGAIGFFGLEDIDTKVKKIQQRLIDRHGVLGRTKQGIFAVRDVILDANLSVENAARLAAYKVIKQEARDKGKTDKEARAIAASVSKNLTVNFNRKGELAPVLNSAYLFYNASIQGSARILTALKSPRVRKIVAGTAATAFALAMYNRAAGGDDDDDIPHWDKISDYLKQTNLIIMHPDGSGNYTKIKMPYGYNVFFYSGTAMHDMMFDERMTTARTAMNMLSAALNAFNPIQGADLLDTITPTFLKPFEQDVRNINFMGTPLKPDFPFDAYDRPESQKYFKSTNPLLKEMMAAINEATGGDETHSGLIDISPEIVKHYISWLTGGAGMTATRTIGVVSALAEGEEIEQRDVPFLRTLGGKPGSRFDTERFYKATKEVAAVEAQLKLLRGSEEWGEYREQHREVHGLAINLRKYKNKIKRLRGSRDKAYKDDDIELANEKREEIRQTMMEFSKKYDDAIEAQER